MFLSIVMVVTYHKVNEYAEAVAALGKINPIIALWGPFAAFAALIWWMYWKLAYVPGGQPIGALEKLSAWVAKWITSLVRRRRALPAD